MLFKHLWVEVIKGHIINEKKICGGVVKVAKIAFLQFSAKLM